MPHPNELPPQETASPLPQSPSTWCTLRNGPYKAVDLPNTKNVGLLMQTHQFKLRHRRAKSKFTQIACELALEQIKKDAPVLTHDTGRWEEDAVRLNCWTGRFMQLIQSKTKVLLDQISASSLSPSRGAHGDGARHEHTELSQMVRRYLRHLEKGWDWANSQLKEWRNKFLVAKEDIPKKEGQDGHAGTYFAQFLSIFKLQNTCIFDATRHAHEMKRRHRIQARHRLRHLFSKIEDCLSRCKRYEEAHKESMNEMHFFLNDMPMVPRSIVRSGLEWAAVSSTTDVKHFLSQRQLLTFSRDAAPRRSATRTSDGSSREDELEYGDRLSEYFVARRQLRIDLSKECAESYRRDFKRTQAAMDSCRDWRTKALRPGHQKRVASALLENLWRVEFPRRNIRCREDYEHEAACLMQRHMEEAEAEEAQRENRPRQRIGHLDRHFALVRRKYEEAALEMAKLEARAEADVYPKSRAKRVRREKAGGPAVKKFRTSSSSAAAKPESKSLRGKHRGEDIRNFCVTKKEQVRREQRPGPLALMFNRSQDLE
mgnify:CR=1 FL=1